jgi:hypothetical protein
VRMSRRASQAAVSQFGSAQQSNSANR